MSPARADFLRLSAELAADIESAAEKANHLKAWGQRLAQGDEVYIPAALLHHYYTAIESCLSRAAATLEGTVPGGPDSHTRRSPVHDHALSNSARSSSPSSPSAVRR